LTADNAVNAARRSEIEGRSALTVDEARDAVAERGRVPDRVIADGSVNDGRARIAERPAFTAYMAVNAGSQATVRRPTGVHGG